MVSSSHEISYFGGTNFRNFGERFGIKKDSRLFHLYALGKTGVGKTSLLKNFMKQDVEASRGFCFLDVHGDTCREVFDSISESDRGGVVYLDVTNLELDWTYNTLEK